jgi:Amt family ammonium transporter
VRKDEFWSFTQLCNGMIAGAVSVAAGCNTIYPWAAFVIGMIGGVVYVMWSGVVSKAGIDDASDSFAIHFGCGAWSLIAVTLFAMDKQKELGQYSYMMGSGDSWSPVRMGGIFYDSGDRISWVRLGWNLFGMLMIAAWVATNMFFIFFILKTVGQLRNDDSTIGGRGGEDKMNHGVDAYVVSASPAVPAKAATGDSVEEGEGAGSVEVKTSQI